MNRRLQISIRGAVQGVGFRPFIFRLASEMNLNGFVYNSTLGVFIEAEGTKEDLDKFVIRIEKEKPSIAFISGMEFSFLDTIGFAEFEIRKSKKEKENTTLILPDIAVCGDCLNEMKDPLNQRYRYPFINCTNCGPRFSIIESLPYDRPNTSMKNFEMCDECFSEYENPLNRRFHAQPIACPNCGPHITLLNNKGNFISTHETALEQTVELIKDRKIIALKGLGGFQLIADAGNNDVVNRLRKRKQRDEKPFALMFPSIDSIKDACFVSDFEERLLCSPEAPIVLLNKKNTSNIADSVSPENPNLGVMLPYTPLHYLLLKDLNFAIIATSGNLSEEPMCIDENDALATLGNIADFFLVHNRPIVRHVDDSIVRIVLNKEMVLRRARGYAPFPINLSETKKSETVLALGGHLKNSIAIKVGQNAFISQHIGDLSTDKSYKAFTQTIIDFQKLYEFKPEKIICDLHPDYLSTKYAESLNKNLTMVQHHYAHVASCRAENQVSGRALGVSWDGAGYGFDGTIWGGEFFISNDNSFEHIGQLRQFSLPGGEKAIKEGRRSALGLLFEIFGNEIFEKEDLCIQSNFSKGELNILKEMLNKKINTPKTSSAGRLFDAVSSLLNVSQQANYEGQSAMKLEFAVDPKENSHYQFDIHEGEKLIVDWEEIINSILQDIMKGIGIAKAAAKFHNTMAKIILSVAELVGEEKVIFSGGCFQNAYLTEKSVNLLSENGYKVYLHQRVPPNDGGLSLGQIAAAYVKHDKRKMNFRKRELQEI